eukprot:1531876-Amphidinium_carterae.1
MCKATRENFKDSSLAASWRQEPLTHLELMALCRREAGSISPLFGAPLVSQSIFKPDWLHTADQGVSQ